MKKYDIWFMVEKDNGMTVSTQFHMEATDFEAVLRQVIYYAGSDKLLQVDMELRENEQNIGDTK
jgi:hypothetical protein